MTIFYDDIYDKSRVIEDVASIEFINNNEISAILSDGTTELFLDVGQIKTIVDEGVLID